MFVNTALLSVLIFQVFVLIDSSIRPDPVIVLNCDPVGTWMRHHHRCVCRPRFHGLRCERIFRCVSGKPRNVSCSYTESKYVEDASKRCLIGVEGTIEVCECFEGYTGSLCERPVEQLPLRLVPDPRELLEHQRHSPYAHEDTYHQNDPQEEAVDGYWTTGIYQWIVFLLLHLILVLVAIVSVAAAMMCYLHRKKSNYRALAEYAATLEKRASERQESSTPPPNYDDVMCRSATNPKELKEIEEQNSPMTLQITISNDQPLYVHV
ncbi:hypothetical protein Q1695_006327 [Nippostrongylus brasiliensis]|nr:hypothetical protein Q1695_006327 [Nippostrongylus brasiliensis]